jgi:hypothetical protein
LKKNRSKKKPVRRPQEQPKSKALQLHVQRDRLTPEQTLVFLDNFAKTVHGVDQPTKLISLRVPQNILDVFKIIARDRNQKYQSVIVQLMRQWVTQNR